MGVSEFVYRDRCNIKNNTLISNAIDRSQANQDLSILNDAMLNLSVQ
jgi:hypothetical protein